MNGPSDNTVATFDSAAPRQRCCLWTLVFQFRNPSAPPEDLDRREMWLI